MKSNISPVSSLRRLTLSLLSLTMFTAGAGALRAQSLLLDYDLGSGQATTVWSALNSTNPTLAPSEGTGILTAGSPAFPAGSGLYSFSANYSVTTSQSGGGLADIRTVLVQIDLAANGSVGFGGGPVLTYTHSGGTGTAAANWSGVTGLEDRATSNGPGAFQNWTFQWDLSGIAEDITFVSILTPIPVHTSTTAAQIDVGGNAFASPVFSAVPEPSATLLGLGALGVTLMRRRRA